MLTLETTTYLGPAEVLERSADGRVRLHLARREPEWQAREVWARPALAFGYRAREGDELLVLGQGEDFYVVGVLAGLGSAELSIAGDIELRSSAGELRLHGERGVAIEGERLELRGRRIEMVAQLLVQKLGTILSRVLDLFQVRAGRQRVLVEGSAYHRAGRTVLQSQGDTRIDGEKIYLG